MKDLRAQFDRSATERLLNAATEFESAAQALKEARNGLAGDRHSQWPSRENMRLQMARAGDVLLRLLETGSLPCPDEKTPWLEIASCGVIAWRVESFVDPSSEGGEVQPTHSVSEFLMDAVEKQERISHGDSLAVWDDAESNFVRRHMFLEAVKAWLPEMIGVGRSNLVLPRWHIRQSKKRRASPISLVSDWLNHEGLVGHYSSEAAVVSECARICDAFAAWARAQQQADCGAREPSVPGESGSIEPDAERTADEASDSLSERFLRAYALYETALQWDPNAVSIERAYELLQSRAETRESLQSWIGNKPLTLETFRRYVSEVKRKRNGPKRRKAQRILHG